jgi:hypothetical protein
MTNARVPVAVLLAVVAAAPVHAVFAPLGSDEPNSIFTSQLSYE